jgi:hypothetical protein
VNTLVVYSSVAFVVVDALVFIVVDPWGVTAIIGFDFGVVAIEFVTNGLVVYSFVVFIVVYPCGVTAKTGSGSGRRMQRCNPRVLCRQ